MYPFSSDLNPVLQAADAVLELHRTETNAVRLVPLREFFLGYRRVAMTDDEILVNIHIPLPSSTSSIKTFIHSYKQARRRDDDICIVSAGLQVQLEPVSSGEKQQWRIVAALFSFGGMGPTTILAKNTQQELIGQLWTKATIAQACQLALKEMPLDEMTPGGQPEYRYSDRIELKSKLFLLILDEHWFNHFFSNFISMFVLNYNKNLLIRKNYLQVIHITELYRMVYRPFLNDLHHKKWLEHHYHIVQLIYKQQVKLNIPMICLHYQIHFMLHLYLQHNPMLVLRVLVR